MNTAAISVVAFSVINFGSITCAYMNKRGADNFEKVERMVIIVFSYPPLMKVRVTAAPAIKINCSISSSR